MDMFVGTVIKMIIPLYVDDRKKKHKEMEFIPDVIVKVTADNPMNRRDLKARNKY